MGGPRGTVVVCHGEQAYACGAPRHWSRAGRSRALRAAVHSALAVCSISWALSVRPSSRAVAFAGGCSPQRRRGAASRRAAAPTVSAREADVAFDAAEVDGSATAGAAGAGAAYPRITALTGASTAAEALGLLGEDPGSLPCNPYYLAASLRALCGHADTITEDVARSEDMAAFVAFAEGLMAHLAESERRGRYWVCPSCGYLMQVGSVTECGKCAEPLPEVSTVVGQEQWLGELGELLEALLGLVPAAERLVPLWHAMVLNSAGRLRPAECVKLLRFLSGSSSLRSDGALAALAPRLEAAVRKSFVSPDEAALVTQSYLAAGVRADALLTAIGDDVASHIDEHSPGSISRIALSMAQLQVGHKVFFEVVTDYAASNIAAFGPDDLPRLAVALAEAPAVEGTARAAQAVARAASWKIDALEQPELVRVVDSVGRLEARNDRLMEVAGRRVAENASAFSAQELALLAGAYARLGCASEQFLQAVTSAVASDAGAFGAEGLAKCSAACAKMGQAPAEMLQAVSQHVVANLGSYSNEHLAEIVWSFSRLHYQSPEMMEAVVGRLEGEPQALVDAKSTALLALGLAALHAAGPGPAVAGAFEALAGRAPALLDGAEPQVIANMALAFATAGHYNPELMEAIGASAKKTIHRFDAASLSALVGAFQRLGAKDPELADMVVSRAIEQERTMEAREWRQVLLGAPQMGLGHAELGACVAEELLEGGQIRKVSRTCIMAMAFLEGTLRDSGQSFPAPVAAALEAKVRKLRITDDQVARYFAEEAVRAEF